MKLTYIATSALIVLVGAGVYLVVQNESEGKMQEIQAANDRKILELENKFKEKAKADEELQRKLRDAQVAASPAMAKKTESAITDPAAVKQGLKSVSDFVNKGADSGKPATSPGTGEVALEPPNYGAGAGTDGTLEPAPTTTDLAEAEAKARRAEAKLVYGAGEDARIAAETDVLTNGGPADATGKLNQMQSAILAQPRIARVGDARAADKAGFLVLDEGLNKGLAKGDRFAVRRGTILVARVIVSGTIEATQCVADIVPNTLVAGMSVKNGDEIIKFDR